VSFLIPSDVGQRWGCSRAAQALSKLLAALVDFQLPAKFELQTRLISQGMFGHIYTATVSLILHFLLDYINVPYGNNQ
jgi:hypothetical protein